MKILYFWAPWCGPCKKFTPIMQEVSEEIEVEKINVDVSSEIAIQYGVKSVPTLFLLENDNVKSSLNGFNSLESVMKWVDSV